MSPEYNTTKYVWTDFGGVLTPPVSHTMRVFCQKYGLTESQLRAGFEAVARNHNLTDPLELVDTPLMSEKEWLSENFPSRLAGRSILIPSPTTGSATASLTHPGWRTCTRSRRTA